MANNELSPDRLPKASASVPQDGIITAADKDKLDKYPTDPSTAFTPLAHVGDGGNAHALAVNNGAAGFMSGADKAKLDGLSNMRIQSGTGFVGLSGSTTVTFPVPFTTTPIVVASPTMNGFSGGRFWVSGISTTSFYYTVVSSSGGTYSESFDWIAVGT